MLQVVDDAQLLALLRSVWSDSLKLLKKSQKRDELFVRLWFQTTFTTKVCARVDEQGVGHKSHTP